MKKKTKTLKNEIFNREILPASGLSAFIYSYKKKKISRMTLSPLHAAVADGDVAKLTSYLQNNKNNNNNHDMHVLDLQGYAPIHLAAFYDRIDCLIVLHQFGADLNAVSKHGQTPLTLARMNNAANCIQFLLSKSAIDLMEQLQQQQNRQENDDDDQQPQPQQQMITASHTTQSLGNLFTQNAELKHQIEMLKEENEKLKREVKQITKEKGQITKEKEHFRRRENWLETNVTRLHVEARQASDLAQLKQTLLEIETNAKVREIQKAKEANETVASQNVFLQLLGAQLVEANAKAIQNFEAWKLAIKAKDAVELQNVKLKKKDSDIARTTRRKSVGSI
jgi:hypothetical protein